MKTKNQINIKNILLSNYYDLLQKNKLIFSSLEETEKDNKQSAVKYLLSGRLKGVSMARKFKLNGNSNIKNKSNKSLNKSTKLNNTTKKSKSILNLPLYNTNNSFNNSFLIKPSETSLNSVDSYRLQYVQKDIFTK